MTVDRLPLLGVGYREEVADEIRERRHEIEALELMAESFIPLTPQRRDTLAQLREHHPILLHSVSLSLGGTNGPSTQLLDDLAGVVEASGAEYLSDHMSLSTGAGVAIRHLSPLWFSREQADVVVRNAVHVQQELGTSLAIETVTAPFQLRAELGWGEFHRTVYLQSGATALLDLTNLVVNGLNGAGPTPEDAVRELAEVRWQQFHVVGYSRDDDGFVIDSHASSLSQDVLDLFQFALGIQTPRFAIVERDSNFADFYEVFGDVCRLRAIRDRIL